MRTVFLLSLAVPLAACAVTSSPNPGAATSPAHPIPYGILLMAHGGSPGWNRRVASAAGDVRGGATVVTAFGMAERDALEAALDSLSGLGVERVAVVRLFLSGSSFLARTERLLGLSSANRRAGPTRALPITRRLALATHTRGLMRSPLVGAILADRLASVSVDPAQESVLALAHGMGDDTEDAQVVSAMREATRGLESRGFAEVEVATLREDWPEKRGETEARIRAIVADQTALGRRVLVVPFRLEGFGPYADVLEGLSYTPTGALLPDPAIPLWIARTGREIACDEGWLESFACGQ